MNNFFFNKYINQQHGNAYEKLKHRACKFCTDEGVGVFGFHTLADNVERSKRYTGQDCIADHERSYIISRVLAMQEQYKTGKQQSSNNYRYNKGTLHGAVNDLG